MQEKSELYVKSAHGSSGAPAVRREKAAAAQKGNRPKVGNNLLLLLGGVLNKNKFDLRSILERS